MHPINTNKALGERLRFLREHNGLTQKQVSTYLAIERSTYSYYERGKTLPSIFILKHLCELYDCSFEELLKI